ncbi:MAG: low affinity iron permease family protein [Devosia sp.]|uniref:low affinity iron permease family protein n=1 Tax=Devosia sp. TaxID=1871048 RepID=UPI001AC83128|nr:low affinity iron permease family protein [Devosia sp.]MBN9314402.1 low affinity iron permease family protein [Devosia sp.]
MRLDRHLPSRIINRVADFLSTSLGFIVTFIALLAGIAIGAFVQFNDSFMFGFNIFLSVAAIVISGVILVAGARSEAALHVKLDYLIEASRAPNKSVGIEHKDHAEIEAERQRIEAEARAELEEAVEEEVSEQLDARGPSTGA